jgi:hypothetical protein
VHARPIVRGPPGRSNGGRDYEHCEHYNHHEHHEHLEFHEFHGLLARSAPMAPASTLSFFWISSIVIGDAPSRE